MVRNIKGNRRLQPNDQTWLCHFRPQIAWGGGVSPGDQSVFHLTTYLTFCLEMTLIEHTTHKTKYPYNRSTQITSTGSGPRTNKYVTKSSANALRKLRLCRSRAPLGLPPPLWPARKRPCSSRSSAALVISLIPRS